MSIEAVGRTLRAPIGGNAKVILLGIANHAHHDGTNAYPAIETLATYADCDRRTAQRNVRRLEDEAWIVREGVGPMGQTRWGLNFARWEEGGGILPPVATRSEGGGKMGARGAAPVPPEPSIEPTTNRPTHGTARAQSDEWPEGIKNPVAADAIFDVVATMAREHGAKVVTKPALGHAMLGAPGRDFIGEAHRMASYYVGRQVRDAVATYRNWLAKADAHYPAVAAAAPSAGFATRPPRRNGRTTAADYLALIPADGAA